MEALASVLHVCDITFCEDEGGDSGKVNVGSRYLVTLIAGVLQVDSGELLSCLTKDTIITRGRNVLIVWWCIQFHGWYYWWVQILGINWL